MPEDLRHNFIHLLLDIGWYGVLNATTMTFLTIYATRIHARADQIGLISAIPALMTMLFALPAGAYLKKRSLSKSAIRLGIVHRSFYFLLVLLPFIANQQKQVSIILLITVIMFIPYSAFSMAFNALFGATVPIEWRGYYAGARNALFAIVTIIVSLLSGFLLETLTFPLGYQIVFGMGFVGALMSQYHIARLRVPPDEANQQIKDGINEIRISMAARIKNSLRIDVLKGPFLRILLVLTLFHFTQFLALPLFPVFYVNELKLSDQIISLGTAIFYVTMFIGSMQHSRIVSRFGNRWAVGAGMILLAAYPAILSQATNAGFYLAANVISGFAWSLSGTALFNYLLENIPAESRPAYLAWFSLLANFGVLSGSLLGPVVGNWIGIVPALVLFAVFRAAAGTAILRWG
ncbi:MAG TPA: MFS transporter [Longilinea sp.]|nr:MFS transporter [Longilinea sp.]